MRTMIIKSVGEALCLAHTKQAPLQDEWDEFVQAARDMIVRTGSARFLVLTEGGGPDALQREQINNACDGHPVRAAVMTDSRIARGIVMAIAWMKAMDIKAFPQAGIEQAMNFLEMSLPVEDVVGIMSGLREQITQQSSIEFSDRVPPN